MEHPAPEELSDYAYSPQEAAEGLREHLADCPDCAAEVDGIGALLASLADLPEPALPESVGIRLDAALARAWQEADAQQERAVHERVGRRRGAAWRKIALPVGALCLLALGAVGVGELIGQSGGKSSAASSGAAAPAVAAPSTEYGTSTSGDVALTEWVHSVLAETPAPVTTNGPNASAPRASAKPNMADGVVLRCTSAPRRPGFTVLSAVSQVFRGQRATLVVYGYSGEPASATVYAVVYAGSCPATPGQILDQGYVSR